MQINPSEESVTERTETLIHDEMELMMNCIDMVQAMLMGGIDKVPKEHREQINADIGELDNLGDKMHKWLKVERHIPTILVRFEGIGEGSKEADMLTAMSKVTPN